MLVAVYALGLGACVRHTEEHRVYGSIKDDAVVATPKPRLAKVAVAPSPSAPPARAMQATPVAAPVAVATAEPAKPIAVVQQTSEVAPLATSSSSASSPATPVALPLSHVDDEATATTMLLDGQTLFDAGKVVEARRLFMAAISSPVPEIVLALGRSYDTYYLSRLPASDAAPDMQRALVLYERAMERGAANAAADLERTRGILKIPR